LPLTPGRLIKPSFDFSDPHRDLNPAPVDLSHLGLHVAEICERARCALSVHLSDCVQSAAEPPPLALHLTFQFTQFFERIRQLDSSFHSRSPSYVHFLFFFCYTVLTPPASICESRLPPSASA
jgi:hypothetical protein